VVKNRCGLVTGLNGSFLDGEVLLIGGDCIETISSF
jgi:hypothetical protein